MRRRTAPWGLAMAPDGFGSFAGDLIVGNFGDGRLHAFRWGDGGWHQDGTLSGTDGRPLRVGGLWGIGFGAGNANSGPATTLYFAAGPDDEAGGSFGTIAP